MGLSSSKPELVNEIIQEDIPTTPVKCSSISPDEFFDPRSPSLQNRTPLAEKPAVFDPRSPGFQRTPPAKPSHSKENSENTPYKQHDANAKKSLRF